MKKLAFICAKNLESFIEPIVHAFEAFPEYQTRRFYCTTNQEVIAAVKWADICWLEWCNESTILAMQVYELKKRGVIVRLHSYEVFSDMPGKIDWSLVDYLVFVAPHIREIVKGKIPDIEKRVCTKVIYNGVDVDRIPLLDEPGDPHDIAFVANINHKKEPVLALQIIAKLAASDSRYRLHIAGAFQDERYQIYMKHMVKEMGIEDNVLFYGFVKDMGEFWKGKGALLSTSIHEGHPYNVMEAAAQGIRPVVHNFYGAKDLYPESWLFNTVDEAIARISAQHHCEKSCRDYVIDRGWTLSNQVAQFKKLVAKLAKGKAK